MKVVLFKTILTKHFADRQNDEDRRIRRSRRLRGRLGQRAQDQERETRGGRCRSRK